MKPDSFCPDSPELLRTFVAETEELLDALAFDVKRRARPPSDLARRARRAVHTIKGNATMLGLDQLVQASHEAERQLVGESAAERVLEALDAIGPQIDRLREQLGIGVGVTSTGSDQNTTHPDRQMIRVDHSRLLELERLVGEVSAATRLVQDCATKTPSPMLESVSRTLSGHVSALENAVTRARMQPFAALFGRANRLARELSASTNLPATLASSGEDVEVDRAMLDALHPVMVQLIRNTFAHGFEPPAERRRIGKPDAGRISIDVSCDDTTLVVRYSDDGRGLDRDRIRARAVGFLPADTIDRLGDGQVDRLILEPGLTTSATAGVLSGRGIGMDVVRTQIEYLNGRIEIDNSPGQGVTFRLIVPVVGPQTSG